MFLQKKDEKNGTGHMPNERNKKFVVAVPVNVGSTKKKKEFTEDLKMILTKLCQEFEDDYSYPNMYILFQMLYFWEDPIPIQ